MTTVRIRDVFRRIHKHNPISGHSWTEHGPTTGYEVVGMVGTVATCRSEKRAKEVAAEWQAFYDKFGL